MQESTQTPDGANVCANIDKFGNNMWRRPAHYAGAIMAAGSTSYRGFRSRNRIRAIRRKVITDLAEAEQTAKQSAAVAALEQPVAITSVD
jgi:hypothetical protein